MTLFERVRVIVLIPLAIIGLPILLPLGIVVIARRTRRRRRLAAVTRCVRCQTLLGPEGLDAADQFTRETIVEGQRKGLRVNPARIDAICGGCGCWYVFEDGGFHVPTCYDDPPWENAE